MQRCLVSMVEHVLLLLVHTVANVLLATQGAIVKMVCMFSNRCSFCTLADICCSSMKVKVKLRFSAPSAGIAEIEQT